MKTASQSMGKYVERSGASTPDYVSGAQGTSKDQAGNAIAAAPNYNAGVQAAITRGAYAKGLQKSGKAKWLKGVTEKGANRYSEGVASGASDYATNSGAYDPARNAAANLPRGPKGSEQNFTRSKTVGQALRAMKVGK